LIKLILLGNLMKMSHDLGASLVVETKVIMIVYYKRNNQLS